MSSPKAYTFESSKAFMEVFDMPPYQEGALLGLTFAVKDIIDVKGYTNSFGNPDYKAINHPAATNAVCVEQLLTAGAHCLGKTIADDLCFSFFGENYFYGTPINPKAPDRVPGGSSSGSASAVACGLVDFALGTDTGGSIRVPAHNCGIYGFRPSWGAISTAGVIALSPSIDTVGIVARNADILSRAATTLLGKKIPITAEVGTIYILTDIWDICDNRVKNALEPSIRKLKKLYGDKVQTISLDNKIYEWRKHLNIFHLAEIWSSLGGWIEALSPTLSPLTNKTFFATKNVPRNLVQSSIEAMKNYFHEIKLFMGTNNLICIPTAPTIAPLKGDVENDDFRKDYNARTFALTALSGVGKLPQISIPVTNSNETPVGLSLLGPYLQDTLLLRIVENYTRS